MATFISLVNLTQQGIRDFKDSPDRATKFKSMAEKVGVKVKDVYWTMGVHDVRGIPSSAFQRKVLYVHLSDSEESFSTRASKAETPYCPGTRLRRRTAGEPTPIKNHL